MLADELNRLHRLPVVGHTVAFGVTRTVAVKTPMVAFDASKVWVRAHGVGGGEQVIVHRGADL